ncbi:MAG: hypothetical protein E6J23_12350 [Chloroflexi bacterium]|nr:MAG: hypothetical protein E6J23_12350 [Chloroflexota bacterium]
MKRTLALIAFLALVLAALSPAIALADSATHTYQFHMEHPNISEASNGDRVAVTGMGTFSVHPDSVRGGGTFTHTNAGGSVIGKGTWTATELIEYQSYGCGAVMGNPLPPNFCGGALKMRIVATPGGTNLQIEAILTIFCIVGPNPPNSHDDPSGEGIHLVVPGIINFNKIVEGMNIYIQQS